jgi:hypothetical protein
MKYPMDVIYSVTETKEIYYKNKRAMYPPVYCIMKRVKLRVTKTICIIVIFIVKPRSIINITFKIMI